MIYDPENVTDYIKWLLSQLDDSKSDVVDKREAKIILLSIIGEVYGSGVSE